MNVFLRFLNWDFIPFALIDEENDQIFAKNIIQEFAIYTDNSIHEFTPKLNDEINNNK